MRLTPEEWVRQYFLHMLVDEMSYPKDLMAVEAAITVGEVKKRCDAIVYSKELKPLCIIEFKQENVELTQQVFDQVAVYNRNLNVGHLILSNGKGYIAARFTQTGYEFLTNIPSYEELNQSIQAN